MVYGRYNYSIHGVYKPTYTWGAPSCWGSWTFPSAPTLPIATTQPNDPRDSHDHGFGEADPFSLPRLGETNHHWGWERQPLNQNSQYWFQVGIFVWKPDVRLTPTVASVSERGTCIRHPKSPPVAYSITMYSMSISWHSDRALAETIQGLSWPKWRKSCQLSTAYKLGMDKASFGTIT